MKNLIMIIFMFPISSFADKFDVYVFSPYRDRGSMSVVPLYFKDKTPLSFDEDLCEGITEGDKKGYLFSFDDFYNKNGYVTLQKIDGVCMIDNKKLCSKVLYKGTSLSCISNNSITKVNFNGDRFGQTESTEAAISNSDNTIIKSVPTTPSKATKPAPTASPL